MSDNLAKRIENLEYKELKEVCSLINNADLEGIDKLRVVAIKKDKMVDNFANAVEIIAEKHGEEALPEKALLLFNDLFGEGETRLDGTTADETASDAMTDANEESSNEPAAKDESMTKDEPVKKAKATAKSADAKASSKKAKAKKSSAKKKTTGPKKAEKKQADTSSSTPTNGTRKKKNRPSNQTDKYGTRPYTLARAFVESLQDKPKTMKQIQKEDWNPRGFVFPETLNRLVEAGLAEVDDKDIISIVG